MKPRDRSRSNYWNFLIGSAALAGDPLRRFEKSRPWAAEGALNIVSWLRSHGKLSGGAAMERVAIARQLEQLPETEKEFQRGELGFEHVATLRRTVEHVGIRRPEGRVRFAGVGKTA